MAHRQKHAIIDRTDTAEFILEPIGSHIQCKLIKHRRSYKEIFMCINVVYYRGGTYMVANGEFIIDDQPEFASELKRVIQMIQRTTTRMGAYS